jgi:cytoskeletal protein RodZ
MRPVGPQPPSVYWVRRVVVLVVVVAIVAGVVWFVAGRDGTPAAAPDPMGSPASTPVSSVSPSPSESSPSPTKSSASPKPTKTTSPKPSKTTTSPAAPTACPDSAIDVVASTDAASYKIGATPRLRMRITNSSTTACKRDIGASANELIVNQGSDRFWSSDDCNPGGKADVVVLQPGQSYSVSLGWLGRGSKPGCPADQPVAEAGTYNLVGRNGDVMSSPQKFSLTD